MNMSFDPIEHPAQGGWSLGSDGRLDVAHRGELARRLGSVLGDELSHLFMAVEIAGVRVASFRQMHEIQNVSMLNLSEPDRALYDKLSGDPEEVGHYIQWFGKVATVALKQHSKVSLDLGGKMQLGDWECTGPLDQMARSIPSKVAAADTTTRVSILDDPTKRSYNYYFVAHLLGDHEAFDYASVRRRRPVANIKMQQFETHLEIFKESTAVVIMNQLPQDEQQAIRSVYANLTQQRLKQMQEQKNNSPQALVAGRAFERAIYSDLGSTRDIIPISAHYIISAHRQPRNCS